MLLVWLVDEEEERHGAEVVGVGGDEGGFVPLHVVSGVDGAAQPALTVYSIGSQGKGGRLEGRAQGPSGAFAGSNAGVRGDDENVDTDPAQEAEGDLLEGH